MMASCGWVLQLPAPFEGAGGADDTSEPNVTSSTTGGGADHFMGGTSGTTADVEHSTGGSNAGGAFGSGGDEQQGEGGTGAVDTTGSESGGTKGSGGMSMEPECADDCDCDEDGEKAMACGGEDCDDHDDRVYPEQPLFFGEASSNSDVGFDYNCSGGAEREPELNAILSCGKLLQLGCEGEGFKDQKPACGATGTWGECEWDGLKCVFSPLVESERMKCH